jgi:hypothetical protein
MVRYIRKQAVLAKIESSYGADALPTGTSAMLMTNAKFKVEAEEVSRDLMKAYMGHQGIQLVGRYASLSGDIEIAGAGVAGDSPGYATLLRMCGFAATVTAGLKVEFLPVSADFEAGTIYFNLDGVNHVLLGARGNVSLSFKAKSIPKFTFSFKGLSGSVGAEALPVANYTKFIDPTPVAPTITNMTLHGYSGGVDSLDIDVGAQIEPRLLINHNSIQYVDRQATGSVVLDAPDAGSSVNFFTRAKGHQLGTLAFSHGVEDGNIVEIAAPAVQLKLPEYGDSQKIVTQSMGLIFQPSSAGNNELKITVR